MAPVTFLALSVDGSPNCEATKLWRTIQQIDVLKDNIVYVSLKPFIKILDRPIIEWIVKGMNPSDVHFIFVCRGEHLKTDSSMRDRLLALAPDVTLVSIDEWVKKGPVYDVLRAYQLLCDVKGGQAIS